VIIRIKKLNHDDRLLLKIFSCRPFRFTRYDEVTTWNLYFYEIDVYNGRYYGIADMMWIKGNVERDRRDYDACFDESRFKEWDTPEEDAAWKDL